MKTTKIIFWATSGLLFLMQGLMPIFTYQMSESKAAISHLGYPEYFGFMLAIFKLIGGLALIIPQVPAKIKEWAYVGFGLDFIAAAVSIAIVEGLGANVLFPVIAFIILLVSYLNFHKLNNTKVF